MNYNNLFDFTIVNNLANGGYGNVFLIKDKSGNEYALKKNMKSKKSDFIISVREWNILELCKDNKFIIDLVSVVDDKDIKNTNLIKQFYKLSDIKRQKSQNSKNLDCYYYNFDRISLAMDKADGNLNQYCKADLDLKIKLMIDSIMGLSFLHENNIIHRDIKPGNILVKNNVAKICDMGFSCFHVEDYEHDIEILNVEFMPPEIILKYPMYDYKVDIWCLGCTFAILINKRYLNNIKLKNKASMKSKMEGLISRYPWEIDYSVIKNLKCKGFSEQRLKKDNFIISHNKYLGIDDLDKSEKLFNLLGSMLDFNPDSRPTARQLLNYSIFKDQSTYIKQEIHPEININIGQMNSKMFMYKERVIAANALIRSYNYIYKTYYPQDQNFKYINHIFFQAVSILDRYLCHMNVVNRYVKCDDFIVTGIVCLYIAVKLNSTLYITNLKSIKSLFSEKDLYIIKKRKYYELAEAREKFILSILIPNLYYPTVFDIMPHKNNDDKVLNLLIKYLRCPLEENTLENHLEIYEQMSEDYDDEE